MHKYNLYLLFVAMILLIGCTTHIETEPILNNDQLVLPESTANHIKAYRRLNVNPKFVGNWIKTNINIDKGDMLLIFAEGKNTKSVSMCGNLLLTIGASSSQYAAANKFPNRDFSNACYGYFMSNSSGEIKFGFRRKSKGYYTVDLFVISESNEKYLHQTLIDLVDINFDDELFLSQAMSFIENNNWIFYTQLDVTSSPSNAKVYIDDEFKGNTPLKIDKVIKHDARNICIKLDNYAEYCDTFLPKNKSRFYVDLEKIQNKLPASTSASLIDNIEPEIKGKENNYGPTQLVQNKFYFGEYHALVIGNNSYNILPKLNTAVNDAQTIASVLQNQYAYKVNLILNGTRRDILSSLDKLRGELTWKDNLLIYYAGHGYFDKDAERGYWLPIDASNDTSVDWISNADITDKLKALKAKHVIVISDSCYSGTLTRGINIKLRSSNYLMTISQKRSRTVLTSGGLEPVSDSGTDGHSVFAIAFINALRENNEIMDGTQLFSKIRRPIMLNAPQTPQYSDIRFAGHDGGDFLFVKLIK